jgi:hypothetical protein
LTSLSPNAQLISMLKDALKRQLPHAAMALDTASAE